MRNVAVVVVALVLALAGCAREEVDGGPLLDELRDTLIDEGYLAHQLIYDRITGHKVSVQAVLDSDKPAVVEAGWGPAVARIAEIVWTTFPAEVGAVEVRIDLGGERTLDTDWLTRRFGERPDALVEDDFPAVLVVAGAVVLLAGAGALVWRRRRRSGPTAEVDAIPSPRD